MSREQDPFYKRIRRIQRQRNKLAAGYALKVDKNNLIVPRPHYVRLTFPWRGLCLAFLVALGFKAYLMTSLGAQTYASKLETLSQGHPFEQVGAWMMQPDPASDAMARMMGMLRG